MRIAALIGLMLVFASCSSSRPEQNGKALSALHAGNEAYSQKQYGKAVQQFASAVQLSPENATSYYNLANALYRQNKLAPAILNYEKALIRQPAFKEAKENLAIAQSHIPGRMAAPKEIFFMRWWNTATAQQNGSIWAIAALVMFALAATGIVLRGSYRNLITRNGIIACAALLWLGFLGLSYASFTQYKDLVRAVIMQPASLTAKPAGGDILTEIPAGITVSAHKRTNGRVEVVLPDGRSGWTEELRLAIID